jgi:PKD repeat protein/C1A family cysteine protease
MKKLSFSALTPLFLLFSLLAFSQPDDLKGFKMKGTNPAKIGIGKVIDATTEIYPFVDVTGSIFGMSVSGKVTFTSDDGELRIILVDKNHKEYLAYEMYSLLAVNKEVNMDGLCEETSLLDGIVPGSLRIELQNGVLHLDAVSVAGELPAGFNIANLKREIHQVQNSAKIEKLNQNLRGKGILWVAGNTEVSSLSYAEKKQLYGKSKFPPGLEYYVGGVIQTSPQLKAATASLMVDKWDWRNRHSKNWISPVKNQASCGSCWAFAATGATEAQTNLYFNQLLNLDLAEQDILSCSGAGTCQGGYPGTALNYIASTGVVNETAFPYTATDQLCSNKSASPTQLIKIAGKVDFPSAAWPMEEDALKKMIIKYGPLSGGIYDWSHAIVLVGWQVIKEGDRFFTRDLNKSTVWITVPAGSPLIGTTVWIFKNSWGGSWGDAGYVYVQTAMSNVGWTHALLNPVQSLKQTYTVSWADGDGDGYYWWGLGPKPTACPGPSTPDGDDNNATLGPLDAYGYCTVLGGTPVANFTADKTTLNTGGTVNFSDISTNAPTSWSWTFEGGTPANSTLQNPVVTYATAGTYDVSLTVSNTNGSNTKTNTDFITVNTYIPTYCSSYGNATREWISKVSLNNITSNSGSGGITGYQDFTVTGPKFSVARGATYSMSLSPSFSSKTTNAEFFSVWIDFNNDSDFGDAGEQVLTATKIKAAFSKSITISAGATIGTTRMRVSMKRNALPLPCEIITNGEVEDYTIAIGTAGAKSAYIGKSGEVQPGTLKVYPNPAREKLTIELNEVFEGDNCSLYNMQGMLISKTTLEKTITRLNVAGLTSGVYLIEVNNGINRFREKFVKP